MKKQVKIISIIGSPHKNGSTAALCREALKGAEGKGAEVKEIFLKDYRIEFCLGCFNCMAKGECVISDDMTVIKKQMAEADGFILASPNYANSFNAITKQFLERLGMFEFLTSSMFGDKYVAGIATAGGSGADKTAKNLTALVQNGIFKRSYLSGTLGVPLKGKELSEIPEAIRKARELGKKLTMDSQRGRRYPLQNLMSRLIIALLIKPNFKKFILRGKNANLKAVYDNLRLRKLI
jgi:multimeric flavodoxin WrbA